MTGRSYLKIHLEYFALFNCLAKATVFDRHTNVPCKLYLGFCSDQNEKPDGLLN